MLLSEQESYLSYVKKVMKSNANYRPIYYYSYKLTAENITTVSQSAAIKKIEQFYILFLRDVSNVSNKLNKIL